MWPSTSHFHPDSTSCPRLSSPPQRSAAGKISSTRSSSSGANQNRRSRSKFTTLERCTGWHNYRPSPYFSDLLTNFHFVGGEAVRSSDADAAACGPPAAAPSLDESLGARGGFRGVACVPRGDVAPRIDGLGSLRGPSMPHPMNGCEKPASRSNGEASRGVTLAQSSLLSAPPCLFDETVVERSCSVCAPLAKMQFDMLVNVFRSATGRSFRAILPGGLFDFRKYGKWRSAQKTGVYPCHLHVWRCILDGSGSRFWLLGRSRCTVEPHHARRCHSRHPLRQAEGED